MRLSAFTVFTALAAQALLSSTALAGDKPNYKEETLTGDWGGVRTQLSDSGISTDIIYRVDVMGNSAGGIKEGVRALDNLDAMFTIDGEKLFGSKGTSLFIHLLNNNGGYPNSQLVGSAQGIDSIEVPKATGKLYQAWIQQSFMDDKFSVLAGLYDFNSEFQFTEDSALFIHPTFGAGTDISQSGRNGPSIFPYTSLAARVKVSPTPDYYAQAAIFDGVPGDPDQRRGTHIDLNNNDGAFIAAEAGYNAKGGEKHKKLAVGAWFYTEEFPDHVNTDAAGNPQQERSQGLYIIGQHPLYRPAGKDKGLDGFVRFGFADSDVNRFNYAWSAGLTYAGIIPGREEGTLGFAVAGAHNGTKYKTASELAGTPIESNETTLELTYSDALTPWLQVQPDVQYVINPNTDPALDDAVVLGLRTTVKF